MKTVRLIYVIAIVFLVPSVIMSCAHTQAVNTENSEIVSPPSGETTVSVPQAGNAEELPIPPQTTGNAEAGAPVQQPAQQLVPENIPQEAGSAPTAAEIAPLAPLSQTPPEMPLAPVAEQTPTTTTESIPGAPLQPAPEAAQPPPEMPLAPAAELSPTPTTTEAVPPAAAPQPAMEMPITSSVQPEQAVPPAPETATIQPENAPAPQAVPEIEKITKHPAIVPGEVLNGMPVYINAKTTHTVRSGEDLHWLAAVYYGNARKWTMIYEANKQLIKDPNHLVVGTKLVIPSK